MKPPQTADLLVLTENFPPAVGGSAVLLHEVYRRLQGSELVIITPQRSTPPPAGYEVVHTPIDGTARGWRRIASLGQHVRLARTIRRAASGRRAVVHCARVLPEGLPAALARVAFRLPFLCWVHGEEVMTAGVSREYSLGREGVFRAATGFLASSRNAVALLQTLGIDRRRIHLAYPGVDSGRFATPAAELAGSELRRRLGVEKGRLLLSVGRLQRRKGHDLVLRALARIRPAVPDLYYAIAGEGEERATLERLAAELGVRAAVTFAGPIAENELADWYAAADLFVLPNRVDGADFEGFGLVFLEAAAAGLATIGGRSGGVPEAIVEGRTGLLVSGDDVEELAAAIQRLASDHELRTRLGHAGQQRARGEFSWDRSAERVRAVHVEVAQQTYARRSRS